MAIIALAGCITPFTPEVQQGNIVTPEMVEKLRPGMTKSQVRFVLGTPLVTDSFHQNRWDYVYWYQKEVGAKPERHHLVVIFERDLLARFEGDALKAPVPTANEPARPDKTPVSPNAPAAPTS